MSIPQNNPLRDNLREAYDKYAQERETSLTQDWKIVERAKFLALLQQEHKQSLLEIGAGTGRDSQFFQDAGLETVCIDLSPVMVELCRQKGLKAYVMDMSQIQFPDGSFDAIYAMNSLLHLTKAEFPIVLRRIDALLKPNGVVFLGIYGGYEHEGIWDKDSYTPKRFFSFFPDEHLEQEVAQVFEILSFSPIILDPENPIHFQSLTLKKHTLNP
jgi:SAM-dependent methyltransferase